MNQHKDLLYRQKYATYQLNNRTFSTQNTKISARSLAISYICFQVRIVKKKKGGGGKPYYQLLRKIWWLPHPRPPTRALYAKLQREKLHFLSLLTTILKALICWKLESFRGLCPLGPRQGLCPCTPLAGALRRAPGPHPYEARASRTHGALRARIFPPTPFFCKSWIRHCTHPPLLVQVACPQRRRSWGSWGAVAPPPPHENIFFWGGQTYRFAPPPPNNFVNLKNW